MNGPWRHHGEPMTNLPFQEDIESVHNEEVCIDDIHDFLNEAFVQPIIGETVGTSTEPPIFDGQTPEAEIFYKLLE